MQIAPEVITVLRNACITGNELTIHQSLDRDLYLKVNKVLTIHGAKWDRKRGTHVLSDALRSELVLAIETGSTERKKTIQQEIGFFQTPERLADLLCTSAPSIFGLHVLEPSAGLGRIADAAIKAGAGMVTCVENYPANAQALRDKFDHLDDEVAIHEADFLSLSPEVLGLFDVALMNPPFAKHQDIAHVEHAMKFLRPGGFLAAIMGAGVISNSDRKSQNFRAMVQDHGGELEMLPNDAFKESGTSVKTVMLTLYC
jgi:predicted RNA methylase